MPSSLLIADAPIVSRCYRHSDLGHLIISPLHLQYTHIIHTVLTVSSSYLLGMYYLLCSIYWHQSDEGKLMIGKKKMAFSGTVEFFID
jgi:hypothetical protein